MQCEFIIEGCVIKRNYIFVQIMKIDMAESQTTENKEHWHDERRKI